MIEPKVVKVPFRKLKHIHHISDIQIRNLKRHREYEEVFERTYEQVRKNKNNVVNMTVCKTFRLFSSVWKHNIKQKHIIVCEGG